MMRVSNAGLELLQVSFSQTDKASQQWEQRTLVRNKPKTAAIVGRRISRFGRDLGRKADLSLLISQF